MGINVRNDVNYGLLPYHIALQKAQLSQKANTGRYGEPTYRDQSVNATNERIRQQRQALGNKQRARGDNFESTDAGFNWQSPINVSGVGKDGKPVINTVYRNDGVDPMRTGQWGALGTREEWIVDNEGVINTDDPEDLAKIARVQEMGRATNGGSLHADYFRSPQEIAERKATEQAEVARQEWDRRQQIQEEARTSDILLRQRLDEQEKKAAEDKRLAATNNQIRGMESQLDRSLGDQNDPEAQEFSPEDYDEGDLRALEKLRREFSQVRRDDTLTPQEREIAFKDIFRRRDMIKPNPIKVPKPEVEWSQQDIGGKKYWTKPGQRPIEIKPDKEEKPKELSMSQKLELLEKAKDAIEGADDFPVGQSATPEQIMQKAQEMMNQLEQFNKTEQQKELPIVTDINQVATLPRGTRFRDPFGNIRMVP